MSEKPRGLQITLPAYAENVAVIRHVVGGLAEAIGMDEAAQADLKTVTTEACMNVVVHAYHGEPGPLSVEARPDDEGMTVIVRDFGVGIRPQATDERHSLRLGLSLIAALSGSFAISGGLDRGTEVVMRVPLSSDREGDRDVARAIESSEETQIVVERPEILSHVLERAVGALAARNDLPIDRISDAMLIMDAIAAAAPSGFTDGQVRIALVDEDGLQLRLGPMQSGAADRIREQMQVDEVGGSLESLADELSVARGEDGEYLVVRFAALAA